MPKKKRNYILPLKRRKEKKTNYNRRLKLLLSKKPRLVVRKSLKYTYAQIIKYKKDADQTMVSCSSKDLLKFGWNGSCSNVPAAYLTGFLIGKKAVKNKIKSAVLDVGLQSCTKGGKIYAVLKGAIDAGLNIPKSEKTEEMFPSEDRIKGKHIKDKEIEKIFNSVKAKIEKS
ncbi:MAG: 50S ribosomal protein L18 [Candidatus Aenigmarchaeota archaeon]|nr:50S ribosomal protein L18 [Candidatus Aenigmarchaeota archaeon]